MGAAPRQRGNSEAWILRQPRGALFNAHTWQDQTVSHHYHGLGVVLGQWPLGRRRLHRGICHPSASWWAWHNAMPCCKRVLFDGRGLQLHAATGWAVGLGQHQSDLVAATMQSCQRGVAQKPAYRQRPSAWLSARVRVVLLTSLPRMRVRLSRDRYSTNTLPMRWSISC